MINEQDKKATFSKIIHSDEFRDTGAYHDLLSYLYKARKGGDPPKEVVIAKEVFGIKEFDAERDAKIRVYIYNLRKKLDNYYLNEGKNDSIRISIPKGHYLLTFEKNRGDGKKMLSRHLLLANILFIILVLAINLICWRMHTSEKKRAQTPLENSLVWNNLLKSDLPTLIVFGDYFLYQDTTSFYKYFVRNPRVNSSEDFSNFASSDPLCNSGYKITSLTFLGKFTAWCLNDLIRPLLSAKVEINLRLASNLQWQDFQKNNILFIGSFKTQRIMKSYLANVNFSYQVYPNTLFYHDLETDTTYAYHGPKREDSGFVRDYALVAKVPGPANNTIIVISSTHDIGHMSVVESFTNPEFLSQFEKDYLSDKSQYFIAIFEVQGFERTGFFPKLLHFNNIDPDYNFQLP